MFIHSFIHSFYFDTVIPVIHHLVIVASKCGFASDIKERSWKMLRACTFNDHNAFIFFTIIYSVSFTFLTSLYYYKACLNVSKPVPPLRHECKLCF